MSNDLVLSCRSEDGHDRNLVAYRLTVYVGLSEALSCVTVSEGSHGQKTSYLLSERRIMLGELIYTLSFSSVCTATEFFPLTDRIFQITVVS